MDENYFRELEKNKKRTRLTSVNLVREFDNFLKKRGNAIDTSTAKDFHDYSASLVSRGAKI